MNPISLFEQWFSEELKQSPLDLPAACCLSTLSEDGYPNARFVSLKKITETSFVITGPMDARKGKEMGHSPKAALTFWWATTKRQVRIQGDVSKIPEAEAAIYFQKRHKDAKIVSSIFDQGKTVESIATLQQVFEIEKKKLKTDFIARPEQWSGIYLTPIRIEFMEFKKSEDCVSLFLI